MPSGSAIMRAGKISRVALSVTIAQSRLEWASMCSPPVFRAWLKGVPIPPCGLARLALRDARARSRDDAVDPLAVLVEAGEQRTVEHPAARQLDAQRIDEAAVHQDLIVDVRAGRKAGRADI